MSSAVGSDEEVAAALRKRLNSGLRQIAMFVVPSVAAFLILGDVIVAAIYRTGAIQTARRDLRLGNPRGFDGWLACFHAWAALFVDVLRSARYAHSAAFRHYSRDSHHRARHSLRVPLPHCWASVRGGGAAGLTISAGISSWVEFALLRRSLNRRIGHTGLAFRVSRKTLGGRSRGSRRRLGNSSPPRPSFGDYFGCRCANSIWDNFISRWFSCLASTRPAVSCAASRDVSPAANASAGYCAPPFER